MYLFNKQSNWPMIMDDDLIYCGHRTYKEDCDGCFSYELCPHCGEQMIYEDVFGIMWCEEMYFGPMREEL